MNKHQLIDGRYNLIAQAADRVAACEDLDARRALMSVLLTWQRWASDTAVSTDWSGPLDHLMSEAFDPEARTPDNPLRPHGMQRFIADEMWSTAQRLVALDVQYLRGGDMS